MPRRLLTAWGATLLLFGCALLQAAPRPVTDAAYGQALYGFFQGDYLDALVVVEAAQQRELLDVDRTPAELLRGGLLLSYGLTRDAEQVFEGLFESALEPDLRDELSLRLGTLAQQAGDLDRAEQWLARVSTQATPEFRDAVRLRLGLIALQRQAPQRALEQLAAQAGSEPRMAAYLGFNRAVALQAMGETAAAVSELAGLGGGEGAADPERLAIRDRANLAAGYQLLEAGDPGAADYFSRVRLRGPSAELALLGAGWAAANAGDYTAALTPWGALLERDEVLAPVLEARLALAFAQTRRGAGRAAETAYHNAMGVYEDQLARLHQAQIAIDSRVFADALAGAASESASTAGFDDIDPAIEHLGGLPGAELYAEVLMEPGFRRELAEYLELHRLRLVQARRLADLQAFATMLDARRARYQQVLPRIGARLASLDTRVLRERRDQLARRLEQARQADAWALASDAELRSRQDLQDLRARAEAYPEPARREPLLRKIGLLQGVLGWQVEAAFIERRWQAQKQLRDLDREWQTLESHLQRLGEAGGRAETTLAGLRERLQSQRARLQALQPRIEAAQLAVTDSLRERLRDGLGQRRELLQAYLRQARFGLAELYDRSLVRESAP